MNRTEDMDLSSFDGMLSRYMKGQMSDDEEAAFKQLLKDNDTFRDKAIATARLVKAMQQVGSADDKETVKAIRNASLSDVEMISAKACDTSAGKPGRLTLRRFVLSFSAAASILLCLFGTYRYYRYNRVNSIVSEYLTYFPASEYSRGESDAVEEKLKGFYSDIETKSNLDATVKELKTMWDRSRSESYNDYTEYMPQIGWLLANAYLRKDDKSQASGVLDVLIDEYPAGSAMGDKARELKRKIEEL